ncbi:aliphatic sulfonate ABC transporter substrate-binding protein [Fodinisporobacter ferrooxydans]|uniref:Aliphatic sulfonate ABC transporter substrate-binding protein n=1 Tax=Fodinisporobacter ferrooxydans TaxID=2901836 RepID=A0ABY4CDY7_9BACL|nr:aliphatic sulfonate ABC transporter substrate-binding protein [Alicyclobacillaceae bacterium MYW30-H2]
MKKIVSLSVLSSLVIFSLSGCGSSSTGSANVANNSNSSSSGSNKLPVVRVAYMPDIHGAAPIIIGQKEGFFKKEGLDVKPVKFTSGPPEVDAMAAGQIDMAYLGPGAIFLAAKGKTNIIAVDSLNVGDMILANPKSGIKTLADLKGHTIGVPKGTSGEMILDLALKKAGLTNSDVKVVNMDVSSAVSGFVAGHVDAVAIWNPYTSQIEKQVPGTIKLADDKDFMPEYTFPQIWTANPEFEKNHKDVVQKFVNALAQASDWRMQHIQQAVKMTADFVNAPADALQSQSDTTQWLSSADIKKDFADGSVGKWCENLEKLFIQTGKLDSVVPSKNFVHSEFYQNLH